MILFDGTHLVSDLSLEELHRFARRVGLKRLWFQEHNPRYPHYDILSERYKQKAILLGAKQTSSSEIILALRRLRAEEREQS